ELGPADASGRRSPRPVPGETFRVDCDMVIASIGQSRLIRLLETCAGVRLNDGRVEVEPQNGQTSNPKYYAGGDCANGGKEVVDAVAEGKRAGLGIAHRLRTE
ncbi:MAG: FAD-dependent oxidoreductase, partial [Bryobacteraceae bacterium]